MNSFLRVCMTLLLTVAASQAQYEEQTLVIHHSDGITHYIASEFMPLAGRKDGAYRKSGIQNWTSSAYAFNEFSRYAYFVTILMLGDNTLVNTVYNDKFVGLTVRAVAK